MMYFQGTDTQQHKSNTAYLRQRGSIKNKCFELNFRILLIPLLDFFLVLERFWKRGMCDICLFTGCLFVNEHFTDTGTSMAKAQIYLPQSLLYREGIF